MGLGPPEGAYENPHRPVGSQEVLSGRLSAPGAPARDEKRRGAAFPGGRARGVFPRRLIGGSDRSLWPSTGRATRWQGRYNVLMTSQEIRQSFLDYFAQHGPRVVAS